VLVAAVAAGTVGVGFLASSPGPQVFGLPLIAACALVSLGINLLGFVPASLAKTERFYDLTGTITYLAILGVALGATWGSAGPRSWLVALMVTVWGLRLGLFLVRRIARDGRDARFDDIKISPPRFAGAWTLQALWVFLTSLAATTLIAADDGGSRILWTDVLGLSLWLGGFAIEVVSDSQKSAFRRDPAAAGRFIETGLWAWSRHPNYFGEIVLWLGIFVIGAGVFEGGQWIALLSPVFVFLLLTRGSGVPMLEQRADARWGDDPAYQAYKARTPVLLLRPPRR